MTSIVIAKYNENTEWIKDLPMDIQVYLYTKNIDIPNTGRESSTYLHHIVEHYNDLTDEIIFCQGNPFDHCPDFLNRIKTDNTFGIITQCDHSGMPHHNLPVCKFSDILLGYYLDQYTFTAGAQFKVSKKNILNRPKTFYEYALQIANQDSIAPYIFERLWNYIFFMNHERLSEQCTMP